MAGVKTGLPASLVEDATFLFPDVDLSALDVHENWKYVLGRVLEYGTLESVRWAVDTYGREKISEFIRTRGLRVLSRKTVNYWAMLLGLHDEECIQRFLKGPRNPFWPS